MNLCILQLANRKLKLQELNRLSIDEYRQVSKFPMVVVLDNVRSLYNVGSVFRSADAFCVSKIFLCGITGTPPHREITKTAIGAENSVEWEHIPSTKDVSTTLKNKGYLLWGVEQTSQSISLECLQFPNQPVAFIFGNEVDGISDEIIDLCDACIEIPQFGSKHSLNISVAAGVMMWEYAKYILQNSTSK